MHRFIILRVVYCVFDTRSVMLMEKQRFWMFKNMLLSKIFQPVWMVDELIGDWGKLQTVEFCD